MEINENFLLNLAMSHCNNHSSCVSGHTWSATSVNMKLPTLLFQLWPTWLLCWPHHWHTSSWLEGVEIRIITIWHRRRMKGNDIKYGLFFWGGWTPKVYSIWSTTDTILQLKMDGNTQSTMAWEWFIKTILTNPKLMWIFLFVSIPFTITPLST